MTEPLSVPLADLRAVCTRLLEHLASIEGDVISIDRDFFWSIPAEELYNVYSPPQRLTIGQLSDSWANLARSLEAEEMVTAYDLVWLADVLRSVALSIVR